MYISNTFIKSLMYVLLPTSIIIVLSANNWLFMWVGLELNMLSFIPLMTNSSKFQESDAMIKYFLIQALGSSILLLSTSIMWTPSLMKFLPILISTAMIMKMGMVPCHMWFPSVMASTSWSSCLILSTVQKLAPLAILMYTQIPSYFINLPILVALMNVITGGTIGMIQTKMKSIMAFSSITHMGWMMSAKLVNIPHIAIMYLIMYSILISPIFMYLNSHNINFSHQLSNNPSFSLNNMMMIPILLLSLGGLPPLMGFIPKWMMIMTLGPNFMLIMPLIMGSMMNLYFYLNILFNSSLMQNMTNPIKYLMTTKSFLLMTFSSISVMLLPSWSLMMFM